MNNDNHVAFSPLLFTFSFSLLLSIYLAAINYSNWQDNLTITTLKVTGHLENCVCVSLIVRSFVSYEIIIKLIKL